MNHPRAGHRLLPVLIALTALAASGLRLSGRAPQGPGNGAVIGKQPDGTVLVPTGQTLTPAGENITFDSRPVDMALSPDGKTLAVMLPSMSRLFDTGKNRFREENVRGGHGFGGIAWTSDSRALYASGKTGMVTVSRFDSDGNPSMSRPIRFNLESRIKPNTKAKDAAPAGLALSPDDKTLYVSLFNNGAVAVVDLTSYDPETGAAKMVSVPVGSSPEKIVVSRGGAKIYVANRGGKNPEPGDTLDTDDPVVVDPGTYKVATGTVSVISASRVREDPAHAVVKTIQVGLQPADLALSPDGKRLFAANANSDSVSVIDTESDSVVETIPTSPAPGLLGAGSPNGLALSADGRTLYVTLGGNNAVEVLALSRKAGGTAVTTGIAGLIPTAWFPLAVTRSADGKQLYVANSKGIGSLGAAISRTRPPGAATPEAGPGGNQAAGNFTGHSVFSVLGSLEVIPVPDGKTLKKQTAQVARNNHFDRIEAALKRPPDPFWSRFKHAILVIKENRTYDQVFGDLPVPSGHIGGDPSLLMFGEKITPNQHALAREFGLFDNLYCTGAISADGHHWLNEAFADDYDERAMNNYPRSYPCCGTDPLAYAGNKFLWQAALESGRSFRNYGEFGPLPSMQRHSDRDYNTGLVVTRDRNRDVAHLERILSDMQSDWGAKGLPDLTFIWFSNNHTAGTRPGAYTPESCVADNDLALGKLVEAISHSKKYWQDEPTVIFVVEDDAQGGLDHVEGHRTVGLVISPFNIRGQISSTNFNQLHMVRTIGAILGLKPLNQFDAASLPMRAVFQDKGDFRPYSALSNRIALNLKNPPAERLSAGEAHWARLSAQLDFSAPDRADPEKLTEILWHHSHSREPYPPPAAARWGPSAPNSGESAPNSR